MRSHVRSSIALLTLSAWVAAPTGALAGGGQHPDGCGGDTPDPPAVFDLPTGFQPEGITAGKHSTLFVAGFATGGIYKLDARTGEGQYLVAPDGQPKAGIQYDGRHERLFVAGHGAGTASVYDAEDGALLASYLLADPNDGPTFINDAVITKRAVYFTDSFRPVFYTLPLGHQGQLPAQDELEAIPLSGDYEHVADTFNANGIHRTPDGKALLIVNGANGILYRVNRRNGEAHAVDLGDADVENGDGLVLDGKTLYVVQNFLNQVSVFRLDRKGRSGRLIDVITDDNFAIIATAALLKDVLYVTNPRFDVPYSPDVAYWVTRIPLKSQGHRHHR